MTTEAPAGQPPANTTSPPIQGDGTYVPTDDELRKEYAALIKSNRDHDAAKRENSQRMAMIEQRVLDSFVERGERAIDLVGIGNLHIKKDQNAKIIRDDGDYGRDPTNEERDRARRALEAAGLQDLIKKNFTLQSITAYLKEATKRGETIPDELFEGFLWEDGKYKLALKS